MTKENARTLAARNTKVTHVSWDREEWIIIRRGMIIDELGPHCPADFFFNVTCADKKYDIGWKHYISP